MKELYVWYMDRGWEGSIVAVAPTEDEARKLMQTERNYQEDSSIEKHDILNGLVLSNTGDI